MNNVFDAESFATYVAKRTPDPDLSKRGFVQAERLGRFLADTTASAFLGIHPISQLWVSPVKRAMQTMEPTARATGMHALVRTDLFEAGGLFQADATYTKFEPRPGMTRTEMTTSFPMYKVPPDVTDDGWYRGTGRETTAQCRARARRVARELRARASQLGRNEQIVLVAHYDFICALLDALLLPESKHGEYFERWRHYNTGVTVVDLQQDGTTSVSMANAVAHLTDDPNLVSGGFAM